MTLLTTNEIAEMFVFYGRSLTKSPSTPSDVDLTQPSVGQGKFRGGHLWKACVAKIYADDIQYLGQENTILARTTSIN